MTTLSTPATLTKLNLNRIQPFAEVWRRLIGHIARDWNINSAALRAACKELCVPLAATRGGKAIQAPIRRRPTAGGSPGGGALGGDVLPLRRCPS